MCGFSWCVGSLSLTWVMTTTWWWWWRVGRGFTMDWLQLGPNSPVVWLCLLFGSVCSTPFLPWLAMPWILLELYTMSCFTWCVGSSSLTCVMPTTLWWRCMVGLCFTMKIWLTQSMTHTRSSKDVSFSQFRSPKVALVTERWSSNTPLLRGTLCLPWWPGAQGLVGTPCVPSQLVGGLQWRLLIARQWLGSTCKLVMLQWLVTSVTLQCVVTSGSSPMVPAWWSSGFSCPPYSRPGDGGGCHAVRAGCLPQTFAAAVYLHPWITVLASTSPAGADAPVTSDGLLRTGNPGPIRIGSWHAWCAVPHVQPRGFGFKQRTQWFIKVLQESLQQHVRLLHGFR